MGAACLCLSAAPHLSAGCSRIVAIFPVVPGYGTAMGLRA